MNKNNIPTLYAPYTLNRIREMHGYGVISQLNMALWSYTQIDLKTKTDSLIYNGFKGTNVDTKYKEYCDAMFRTRALSIADKQLKRILSEKEKELNRKLTLSEKHILRDDFKVKRFMELSSLTKEECLSILKNDSDFSTKGNLMVFLVEPMPLSKRKKKQDKERIEVKTNDNINNPNIRYGYFQRVKIDNNAQVFFLIKDIQRRYIGEKLEASPTAYSYSLIDIKRIKRMFFKTGSKWIEFRDNDHVFIDNVWKELE